jgi:hypothetical protein
MSVQNVNEHVFVALDKRGAVLLPVGQLFITISLYSLLQGSEHSHMPCFEPGFILLHLNEKLLVVSISFLDFHLLGSMHILSGLVIELADE